jgi:hypothetical protein
MAGLPGEAKKLGGPERVAQLFCLGCRFIALVIIMFLKKDGGIGVGAKKRDAIGTFF